nr:putative integron gene cassette protein [uncultured bacterium]
MTDEAKLKDGGEWVDHEDCIIGDKQGIENLKKACEVALEKGEYFGNDLGDYVGVKALESSWFKDPQDSKSTRLANGFLAILLIFIVLLVLIGGYTLFSWLF